MEIVLVGNNGYTVQDNPEPERWVRPLVAAKLGHLEFFADHMDPLFAREVITGRSEYFRATAEVLGESSIDVVSIGTGRLSYLQNLISHPYADMRREGLRWLRGLADLAAALGARYVTGHYDYISAADLAAGNGLVDRMVEGLLGFAVYAESVGLEAIFLEQMHSPALKPYTIAEGDEILARLNGTSPLPFYMHHDLGHMAHVRRDDPAHSEADKDPYAWLAHDFASRVAFVHCQQTDNVTSRHWPFTREYNDRGIIEPGRVISSLELSGAERAYLSLEVLYERGTRIEKITGDYVESVENWRSALAATGYTEGEDGLYVRNGASGGGRD